MFSSVSPKTLSKRASILWSNLIGLTLPVSACSELGIRLEAGDARRPASEFQKMIDRRSIVQNVILGALAHLHSHSLRAFDPLPPFQSGPNGPSVKDEDDRFKTDVYKAAGTVPHAVYGTRVPN
jgi:hypothetical protein